MFAPAVVTPGEIDQFVADPRRVRQARQFPQVSGHLPVMIAGRKGGRRFTVIQCRQHSGDRNAGNTGETTVTVIARVNIRVHDSTDQSALFAKRDR